MPDVHFTNLFAVALIALVAPLLLGLVPALRIPAVVLEIVVGIALGPHALGLVDVDLPVQIVALLGLGFLLFLAGLEIDVHRLRGRVLRMALLGYVITLALGGLAGAGFSAAGWVHSPYLLAVTLSATSLGLVVPVLKDAGQVDGQVGQSTIAAASIADFAAVLVLSLLFSTEGGSAGERLVMVALFAILVAVAGFVVSTAGRSQRIGAALVRLQDTTAEIRVRAAVVLLVAFVALAERFGLETILGAFLAGAVVGLVDRDSTSHPQSTRRAGGRKSHNVLSIESCDLRLDLRATLSRPRPCHCERPPHWRRRTDSCRRRQRCQSWVGCPRNRQPVWHYQRPDARHRTPEIGRTRIDQKWEATARRDLTNRATSSTARRHPGTRRRQNPPISHPSNRRVCTQPVRLGQRSG